MSDTSMKFADDFPSPSYDGWVAEVEKALKDAPFDKKMYTKTYDGFTLRPIYTKQDWPNDSDGSGFPGAAPYTRGGRAAGSTAMGWDVRQRVEWPDPRTGNDIVLHELERSVTSLSVRFDAAARAGQDGDAAGNAAGDDGAMVYSVDDLDLLLTGVELDLITVALESGAQFVPAAALLAALWTRRGFPDAKALGAFNADPIGTLAATGSLPVPVDTALAQMAGLAKHTASTYANVTAVGVDTSAYHGAGDSEAQDLAISMATAVAYLRAMAAAGMDVDAACRQILFTYPVGCDQFLGICKLRAARKLWSRVAEACGASESARAMRQHATSAERMMTKRDPWVNMLRTTVSCFASAIGGADSVTVSPFDAALGVSGDLGRRVARNTHVVLAEESNLTRVVDPGGGSWYVEARTDELARAAWVEFQEIEKAGGIVAALSSGAIAEKIAASRSDREKNLAKRKDPLTGVSEFPNIYETIPEPQAPDRATLVRQAGERLAATRAKGADTAALGSAGADGAAAAAVAAASGGATIGAMASALAGEGTTVTALPSHRLAEKFEALRDAADAYKEKTGSWPTMFLANLGPIAKHTMRATFAKNFFEVGGIQTLTNEGFKDAESCAKAFKDSGARAAILCSADPVYVDMVPEVAPALKAAGCEYLFLAGAPGENKDAFTGAGVDNFIFLGGDVLAICTDTLRRLGVIDQ